MNVNHPYSHWPGQPNPPAALREARASQRFGRDRGRSDSEDIPVGSQP